MIAHAFASLAETTAGDDPEGLEVAADAWEEAGRPGDAERCRDRAAIRREEARGHDEPASGEGDR